MFRKLIVLNVFIVLLVLSSNGQMFLADVQFDKIEDEAVEQYLHRQIENNIRTFTDVKPSLESKSSTAGFRCHEKEYVVKDGLDKVWKHYVYTNPGDAWNASKMDFGMMFSKHENQMVYKNDKAEGIDPGQLVYLNLNVLKIKNIATAFEIIKVDGEDKIIEFSYVEDNLTHGKQQLTFTLTSKGYTKIVHRSYFKSKSSLRDHFLYPYFHTRMTNSYHRNMKQMYKNKQAN